MLRNMICGIVHCSPLVLENRVQSNCAITCPMIMQICMKVIDSWFLFLTQPTFLKESGLMRRLDMEDYMETFPHPQPWGARKIEESSHIHAIHDSQHSPWGC